MVEVARFLKNVKILLKWVILVVFRFFCFTFVTSLITNNFKMETKEITMDYLLEQIKIESGDTALDYVYDNELREYHNDYPFNNVDELAQYLYDEIDCKGGFNIDIIYYYKAMEYLMQNDISLSDSMEIASDMGYEVSKLNSEVLASIHASHYARINFIDDNANEIEQLFESLNQ